MFISGVLTRGIATGADKEGGTLEGFRSGALDTGGVGAVIMLWICKVI